MALLSDQSHRHHPLSTQQLIRQTWPMGFISYGGPLAHIGLFRQKFVTQLKWIDDDRFNELTAICQSVPGPTSTQLMISLATYMTESVWGGVLAFLLFFGPSFVVMCVAGMFLSSVEIPKIVNELLSGFKCAAVAVVLQAFWGLSKKYREQNDSVILFTLCAVVYFLIPSITCMFFLFLISTLYCLKFKQISIQKPSKQANNKSFDSIVFGKFSALLFSVLVIVSSFVRGTGSVVVNQMAIFYRIGSVIIGGGHVILPMMWTELSQFGYFTESAFWNGFSIVSCLPGPMFNMAAYVGVLINGLVGAVCCCLALYTPSFLTIWAVLPYWQLYRTNERIQQVIYGLCCASIGFILAAVAMLWQAACIEESSVWHTMVNTAIAMAAYYFLEWKKVPIPYVIFGGGVKFLIKELLFSR